MNLDTAAAIATIVGTVITVGASVLALLGKLRLRLPTRLSSIQSRAFFVVATPVIALPILSWGPKWGLAPSIANLLVIPPLPNWWEETDFKELSAGDNLVLTVTVLLAYMNGAALISMGV
jgi:hypothetical protein